MSDSFDHNQSISRIEYPSVFERFPTITCNLTLLAGFVLNFSNIFCDWVLEAKAAILIDLRRAVCATCKFEMKEGKCGGSPFQREDGNLGLGGGARARLRLGMCGAALS